MKISKIHLEANAVIASRKPHDSPSLIHYGNLTSKFMLSVLMLKLIMFRPSLLTNKFCPHKDIIVSPSAPFVFLILSVLSASSNT